MWGFLHDEMLLKLQKPSHSTRTSPFFTCPCNYYWPLNIFSSCGELLWNLSGIRSDLLGVGMTFGSSPMQPSSSMWTRVARRVTTPFPLHTLLGSKSENIQNKGLIATAPHLSWHCELIFNILRVHSCLSLPHGPNDQDRTVTSKPGHHINILLSP